jgi:hypothetical protein
MSKENHPVEKLVKTIAYKGVDLEVVERPDVLWVGCLDYAKNNTDESDISATLNRYREELVNVAKQELINPDYGAALSINYNYDEQPCGIMFAQETYSDKQDERYEMFTQPGGLWLRIAVSDETDTLHAQFAELHNELFSVYDCSNKKLINMVTAEQDSEAYSAVCLFPFSQNAFGKFYSVNIPYPRHDGSQIKNLS